jgi:CheY-like chemotaxis protein
MLERLALGGLGGLAPYVLVIATMEAETINSTLRNFLNADGIAWTAGYLVRGVMLFFLGAFWVYLHPSESSKVKLFELGIVAPAMLAALLQANVNKVVVRTSSVETEYAASFVISVAYAQTGPEYDACQAGFLNRMKSGFLGIPIQTQNDVIAERSLQTAQKERGGEISQQQARTLASSVRGLTILWVDDHPSSNRLEASALICQGNKLSFAQSNDEALQLLRSQKFDLIISDIARDGQPTNGIDLYHAVRDSGNMLPIIYYVQQSTGPIAQGTNAPVTTMPSDLLRAIETKVK